jgi:translation elongation factor EF-Tu-like GTPase
VTPRDIDMRVERLIEIRDRGTVVVGTIVKGSVRTDDVLEFRGIVARCSAIERYRELLPSAAEGDRVGLLLDGVRPIDLTDQSNDSA